MVTKINQSELPECLRAMPSPPRQLYTYAGSGITLNDLMQRPRIAIVGSRKVSVYGDAVTTQLASELAAQGIVIISGLAIGVDALAHQAALDVKGITIAVLPGPVTSVYPRSHQKLAQRIINNGGMLISEYPDDAPPHKANFVARNRIVTAMSNALLITEAAKKSGTLHTARFAIEQGIDVFAVPGNITSPTSEGTNNLIKSGAGAVTASNDILHALHMPQARKGKQGTMRVRGDNQYEQCIIDLLERGITSGSELLAHSKLPIDQFNHHLTMLEITTKIRPLGANCWALR